MAEEGNSELCTVCNRPDAKLCSRCKSARYCDATCQRADYRTHKLLCAAFAAFDMTRRPSEDHFRAVFFPDDKDQPEIIWLHCPWSFPDFRALNPELYDDSDDDNDPYYGGDRYQSPSRYMTDVPQGKDPYRQTDPIMYNVILKRRPANTVNLVFREDFLFDGSKPNQSIAPITAPMSGTCHDWRGPMLAFSNDGLGLNVPQCKDFDMNDFRDLVDHFRAYNYKPAPPKKKAAATEKKKAARTEGKPAASENKATPTESKPAATGNNPAPTENQPAPKTIKGVRINCHGDEKIFNKPHFEAVDVRPTHPIFFEHSTSDVAERVGIPLFTRRIPMHSLWANGTYDGKLFNRSPWVNQDATFLHVCCDPEAEFEEGTGQLGWGFPPLQWRNGVGSVLLVRQDKKPLFPSHVEALCKYIRSELSPLFSHATGGDWATDQEPISKDLVNSMICQPTFFICWSKLVHKKAKADKNFNIFKEPSPYHV